MKRPFPLQSLLLIFIPLTIAISLIVLWGFNQHQADMRQMIVTRNQHTTQLAAQLLEQETSRLNALSPNEQTAFVAEQLLAPIIADSDIAILIVDQTEQIILHAHLPHQHSTLQTHPGVTEALRGEAGVMEQSFSDGLHIISFAPVPSLGWGLVIEETWAGGLDVRRNALLLLPLLFIPIIAVALFYLWATQQWVLKPLQAVRRAAQAIGAGEFAAADGAVQGVAELVALQTALTQMAGQLQQSQAQLRDYANAIQQGQEEERKRVSQELHDDTIQSLVHLDQQVQLMQVRLEWDEAATVAPELERLRGETAVITQNIRRLIHNLHPTYLDELGLVPAVRRYLDELRERYPQQFILELIGHPRPLDPHSELTLYRTLQETATNALKHANAASISITLTYDIASVTLAVCDDGQGFNPTEQAHGFGLLNLRERARTINAQLSIESTNIQTCVRMIIPTV